MAYFKHNPAGGHEGKIVYNGGIINGIALLALAEIDGVEIFTSRKKFRKSTKKFLKVKFEKDGIHVGIAVKVHFGTCVSDMAFKIQESIKHNVESMTEYKIAQIDVKVLGVIFDDEENTIQSFRMPQ